MVGIVAVGAHNLEQRAREPRSQGGPARRTAIVVTALVAGLLVLIPDALHAQQDTTGARPVASAGDTVPGDTLLTPRERALRRLRAMPLRAVEPDTTAVDTAALDSILPVGPIPLDTPPPDTAAAAGLGEPGEPGEPGPPGGPERAVMVGDTVLLEPSPEPGEPARLLMGDSVMAVLRSLEGYAATEYRGEGAVFRSETEQLELTGASRVGQGRNQLETDSLLVYDGGTGIVCGYGAPVLSGERAPIQSREVCFNIEQNLGLAVGAQTEFQQGATWYVRGAENRVYLLTGGERNTLYGQRAEFTSCELDHPHYLFHARSLKMVENDMMVARDITLRFDDVPVFWLPWMVQSMKRDRRSGLLMPEFGVNDIVRNSSGYNRHISNLGFYWAINDYASARGTFEWYSGNWTAVQGAVSYRWLRQFLRGNLTAKQYWRQGDFGGGRRELTLNTSNSWQPDERTRVQLNANYATSSEFVRDNSFDPNELNRKITSSASVNRSFDWGSVTLGADRSEQISTGQVDMKMPGLSLNLSPVTLFQLGEGSDVTWNGSGNFTRRTRTTADTVATPDRNTVDASYSHSLSLGRVGFSQRVNWQEEIDRGPISSDAVPGLTAGFLTPGPGQVLGGFGDRDFALAEVGRASLGWSNSLSYQQVLWPGTTVSPSVSISGNRVRNERTDEVFVDEPNRLSAGATLNTAIFGFWPGVGPYSRIRHKISPTVRWNYSPEPEVTPLQEEVFEIQNLGERNRLTLSFNQTFEAKLREDAAADTATTDGAAAGTAAAEPGVGEGAGAGSAAPAGQPGEPRRLPRTQTVMLLALDTRTSFEYDFVAAEEEGRGFQTDRISNSIRSDLLQGLQVSTTHSLFEPLGERVGDQPAPRRFAPYLTDLSASFSIDNNFWLFEALGLTSESRPAGSESRSDTAAAEDPNDVGQDDLNTGAESEAESGPGSMIPNRGGADMGARTGVGGWRASLSYSLQRTRPGQLEGRDNQLLSGNVSFQPTEHWSVRWSTAYSFTDAEFANHVLTLSRDLHRWQANFDFIKAQNGNFSMRFRVQLRDNPDLKLDYDQRTNPSGRDRIERGGIR